MSINRLLQIGVLLSWSVSVCGADSSWVRVLTTNPNEARLTSDLALADYGAFAWGQLGAAELADLKQQGVIVSVLDNPSR